MKCVRLGARFPARDSERLATSRTPVRCPSAGFTPCDVTERVGGLSSAHRANEKNVTRLEVMRPPAETFAAHLETRKILAISPAWCYC